MSIERFNLYKDAQEDAIKKRLNIWSQKPEDIILPSIFREQWNKDQNNIINIDNMANERE